MKDPKASLSRNKVIALGFIWIIIFWAGYQVRGIQEGEREMDAEAEQYFEEKDSLERVQ